MVYYILYLVLFGCEVVLASQLETVVSMENGGDFQGSQVLDEPGQLLCGQLAGLRLEMSQLSLPLSYVLPAEIWLMHIQWK